MDELTTVCLLQVLGQEQSAEISVVLQAGFEAMATQIDPDVAVLNSLAYQKPPDWSVDQVVGRYGLRHWTFINDYF